MNKIIIVILYGFLIANSALAEQYNYVFISEVKYDASKKSFGNYENIISIDKAQNLIFEGHTFAPFSTCIDKKWLCVFSESLNFAIPLTKLEDIDSWEYKNYSFKKIELSDSFVGSEKIYKIGVFEKNEMTNFTVIYYSKTRGMIGFSILYGKDTETYWLSDAIGYGIRN